MPGGLSKSDLKAIGALEKGVAVLEQSVRDMDRRHTEHGYDILKAIEKMRDDFQKEVSGLHVKLDTKTDELHTQIDNVIGDNTKLKLHVQKLATTVSVVVGVGIYIFKGVYDAAKETLFASIIHH